LLRSWPRDPKGLPVSHLLRKWSIFLQRPAGITLAAQVVDFPPPLKESIIPIKITPKIKAIAT
jgi:hypothetical protein